MPEKFVILSDLHLGREPERVRADMLRPVWAGAQHVIINGDVAELFDPRYIDLAEKETLRLQELCEADGVTLTLLAGNHDPDVSEQRFLSLLDDTILITHGDSVHPAIAPWCATAPVMLARFNQTMESAPIETRERLEHRLAATRQAALAKWEVLKGNFHSIGMKGMLKRPWTFAQVIHYWMTFPSEAAKFAEEYAPNAKVIITGHTHRQGIWKRGVRTIINTGGYAFPAQPRVVTIDGNEIRVNRVRRVGDEYQIVAKPLVRFSV